jgi:hypothetical protein
MMTSIRLGNFKAIGKAQNLPLKPITLLYGPNSSGKSSVLHGLLFACHAAQTGDLDVHQPSLGGDVVDLGGFRRFVYRRNPASLVEWGATLTASEVGGTFSVLDPLTRVGISCLFGLEAIHETPLFQGRAADANRTELSGRPRVQTVEVLVDNGPLIRMSGSAYSDRLKVDLLKIPDRLIDQFLDSGRARLDPTSESRRGDIIRYLDALLPQMSCRIRSLVEMETFWDLSVTTVDNAEGDQNTGIADEDYARQKLGDLPSEVGHAISAALQKVRYLGPLRSYPARFSIFSGEKDVPWSSSGAHAWSRVRDDEDVRSAINLWLKRDRLDTPYQLAVRQLIPLELAQERVNAVLDEMLAEVEEPDELAKEIAGQFKEISTGALRELVLLDQRSNTAVSHRDVGLGISQVLPVLVSAYGSREKIVCIEQPELHLHPKLQADLSDVFIECALGSQENTFVLETHSEHLMLRILRRIRETTEGELPPGAIPVRPADVAAVYADPSPEGTQLIEIPIREDGEFAEKWPKGFFAERSEELF